MNPIEKTKVFIGLLTLDKATRDDLYAKYSILADAYTASGGKSLVISNKETFEIILSNTILDYMIFLMSGGSLAPLIASNPNVGRIFDRNSSSYIRFIINDLKEKGWNIPKDVTIDNLKQALSVYGLKTILSVDDREITLNKKEDLLDIDFDDDDINASMNDLLGDEEETGEITESTDNRNIKEQIQETENTGKIEEPTEEQKAFAEAERVVGAAPVIGDFEAGNKEDTSKVDEVIQQIAERDKKIQEYVEQQAERKEAEELKKAVENETKDKVNVDKAVLTKTVRSIMQIYELMYSPLFQAQPVGILTSAGIVSIKSNNALNVIGEEAGNTYAIRMYQGIKNFYGNAIRELDYHEEVSIEKCINPDGTLKCNYIPNFHIRNVYGVYVGADGTLKREKKWIQFKSKLQANLTKYVSNLLGAFKGDVLTLSASLVELFTTVFIVEDFDINKSLKMSMKSMEIKRKFDGFKDMGDLIKSGSLFPIDETSLDIMNNSEEEYGVHNLLAIFDKKTYNNEIMFAYKPMKKIVEGGGTIGLQQTLLGRDLKGRNVTYNFESPQAVDSLVIAGSGSGKGVVTLNMLATFIAEGCPTVYIDWKPDMAAMLWDLERKTGARILAIDGKAGVSKAGVKPVRDYGVKYNEPKIANISDGLNVIPYLKAFQIMVLCAAARNINYNGMSAAGKKMQFVLDEAQAMNKDVQSLSSNVDDFLNDKENKPGKNKPETGEYKYVKKLRSFLDSLFNGAVTFRNTTGRNGNVGLIMLGQQADCSAWASGGGLKRDTFGFLVGNCSMKMLGKDATGSTKYEMGGATPVGNELLGNMGYFALIPQSTITKGDSSKIKVIKTYLVLNENDFNPNATTLEEQGNFTGGMLKNIVDDDLRQSIIEDDFYPMDENTGERYINRLVGFQGIVEYIGSSKPGFDLNRNLESGYVEVEKLLGGLGIIGKDAPYPCIEAYLFDCSYNSLFTIGELEDLMIKGETVQDLLGDDKASKDLEEPEGTGFGSLDLTKPIQVEDTKNQVPGRQDRIEKIVDVDNRAYETHNDSGQVFKEKIDAAPECMKYREKNIFQSTGKTNRTLYVTPDETTKVQSLTKSNSIVVNMPPYTTAERYHERLFKTLWGTQYEFKNRWRAILDGVADNILPDLVTRVLIIDDVIFFNKKQVATINILGGDNDVRLEDIVNFTMLANRFKNIKELWLDTNIIEQARMEFNQPPFQALFNIFKRLQLVFIFGENGEKYRITRNFINQEIEKAKARELEERAKLRSQMDVICAARNPHLHNTRPGYQNKVWLAAKSFSGDGWRAAYRQLEKKDGSYFKAASLGLVTLGVLGVGAVFQTFGSILNMVKSA